MKLEQYEKVPGQGGPIDLKKVPRKDGKKWTEGELIEFIKNTYNQDKGWMTLDHVRSSAGQSSNARTADAIAFCMWPSRGHDIVGFEVKISYTDWQKELSDPEKADAIARYCDQWYMVAPRGVIPVGELPGTWGLMEPVRTRLKIVKKAERIGDGKKPLPRGFVSTIFRRFDAEYMVARREELQDATRLGITVGREKALKEGLSGVLEDKIRRAEDLDKKVKDFEKASGIDIEHSWNGKYAGENLRWFLDNEYKLRKNLPMATQEVEKVLEVLKDYEKRLNLGGK